MTISTRSLNAHPDDFTIDFDDVWRYLGYSTRYSAKRFMIANFKEGYDFMESFYNVGRVCVGRPRDEFRLSLNCVKKWGLTGRTNKCLAIQHFVTNFVSNPVKKEVLNVPNGTHPQ